jgi:hypothetical protein
VLSALVHHLQALFALWNLLAFMTAPLEQAALAYVPATAAGPAWQQRSLVALLLGAAGAVGVVSGMISAGVPLMLPQVLTRDPAVWGFMMSAAPLAFAAMLLVAIDVGACAAAAAVALTTAPCYALHSLLQETFFPCCYQYQYLPLLLSVSISSPAAININIFPCRLTCPPLPNHPIFSTIPSAAATGVLLARRDLGYVARAYLFTLSALALYVWAGVYGQGWGLQGVWAGLVLFFMLRCAQSTMRLAWLERQGPVDAAAAAAARVSDAGPDGSPTAVTPAPQGA